MKNIISEIIQKNMILNNIYSNKEIKEILIQKGKNDEFIKNFNITSLSYNRWNKGMFNNHLNPLFEYINKNEYRYLGPNFNYTGDIVNYTINGSEIKIGFWIEGKLFDYNNELSKYRFDYTILTNFEKDTINDLNYLIKSGWEKVAQYSNVNGQINIEVSENINRKTRTSLVYCLIVKDKIRYIGKTVQGYIRPLGYHKNNVMKNVQGGIMEEVNKGNVVEVYCRSFDSTVISWNELNLNIIEPVEQALILKFNPVWNRYKHQ